MEDNRGSQALRRVLEFLTQVELASRTGISQSHISRLSDGKRPALREDALALQRETVCKDFPKGILVEWWDEPPSKETSAA